MTDPIERINNANTIKELVGLIKGEAELFSKDKHDWYECMFGDMAVLYNALAERLSVLDNEQHVAMTEIYAIAFRPENSLPEYAAETIDAIERIAGKALCVGEVHEPKPRNCDIYNTKDSAIKACPFCGSEGGLFSDHCISIESGEGCTRSFVACVECSALVSGKTEEEAIAAWNRRANDE